MFRAVLIALLLPAAFCGLHGQAVDTVGVSSDTTRIRVAEPPPLPAENVQELDTLDWRQRHSPVKATVLSAVLPGAGQIYNRKYWKAPIVWAGLGTCIWFIRENHTEYHRYRDAYLALVDDDPNTQDEFEGRYSPSQVRQVMETYQRWRDLSYLITIGVYAINVIDASVDAHFVRFDVSPELSLGVGPSLPLAARGGLGLSLQLSLR
jgi:hypothetical protein